MAEGVDTPRPGARPSVDVVVPFAGSDAELADLVGRLGDLRLAPGDSLTVVDNRPLDGRPPNAHERVIAAPERQSSYFARNRGAERGKGEWIVFIDADVEPRADLLDRYFDDPPDPDVAVLAGGIHDQGHDEGDREPAAARYAFLRKAMHQDTTKAQLGPFAKTANAAVRRRAFEDLGGFRDNLRSGGDVDLSYRARASGWRLEPRPEAVVEHQGRETVRALLRQQARHGAGTQWLDGVYPGFSPPFRWSSLVVSLVRGLLKGGAARVRGDRDRAILEMLGPATALAFHLGRLTRNEVD